MSAKGDNRTGNSAYHVLVIDDDPVIAKATARALETLDRVEVATAEDGFEAGLQAVAFKPDLLILDLIMPEADGFEVCRRIRHDSDLSQVKILIVTAHGSHENLKRALAAGADDFVHKPVDFERLRQRVRALLDMEE